MHSIKSLSKSGLESVFKNETDNSNHNEMCI